AGSRGFPRRPRRRDRRGRARVRRMAAPARDRAPPPLRRAGRRRVGAPARGRSDPHGAHQPAPRRRQRHEGDRAVSAGETGTIWKQPRAVWAVAFASVVAFMGIGLVDPILPAIAEALEASPAESELLFTSYLVITGAMMLFTSFLSSRLGAKRTLLIGLAFIFVFSLLCAVSGSVDAVIGFRAGWGLGNALFIATALATIVGSAAGGSSSAIMLYEASMGLGLAIGPLVGGLLGSATWRAPFFGVTVLMAIAFIAVITLL